jgi:hypothetical protein
MIELLLPSEFDTLEYSWVKALQLASIHLQIILWLRNANKLSGAVAVEAI